MKYFQLLKIKSIQINMWQFQIV